MKLRFFVSLSVFLIQAVASASAARTISVADPKGQLTGIEGSYKVVSALSSDEDSFCSEGSSYTVRWFESRKGLALSIGEDILMFNNLNAGPSETVEFEDEKNCSVQTDTQTETGRLTSNVFTKCGKEKTTELSVLKFANDTIEYKKEIKHPIKGKTVVVTSTCVLKKKEK